jgi:hypothetical protein
MGWSTRGPSGRSARNARRNSGAGRGTPPARWSWTISSGTASPSTRADPDDRALGVLPGRGGRRVHGPEVPPVLDDGIDLGTMTVGRFEAGEEQKLLLQALAASLTANPGAGTDKVPGLPGGTAQPHRPHPDRQGRHGAGLPGPRPGSQPVGRGEGTGECRCPPPTACSVSGRRVGSSGSCVILRSSACTRHGPRRRGWRIPPWTMSKAVTSGHSSPHGAGHPL